MPLVPHGRSGGGIHVGIEGKAAHDPDRPDTPAIGLHRRMEPASATGRKPRQQYHRHEQKRVIYSFG